MRLREGEGLTKATQLVRGPPSGEETPAKSIHFDRYRQEHTMSRKPFLGAFGEEDKCVPKHYERQKGAVALEQLKQRVSGL